MRINNEIFGSEYKMLVVKGNRCNLDTLKPVEQVVSGWWQPIDSRTYNDLQEMVNGDQDDYQLLRHGLFIETSQVKDTMLQLIALERRSKVNRNISTASFGYTGECIKIEDLDLLDAQGVEKNQFGWNQTLTVINRPRQLYIVEFIPQLNNFIAQVNMSLVNRDIPRLPLISRHAF